MEALDGVAALTDDARARLRTEIERGRLTGRGYHRIRRVARTIADLGPDPGAAISGEHVELALSLRARLRPPLAEVAA